MLKEDTDRKLFADGVADQIKQLGKLLELQPPLTFRELAFRMAIRQPELRRLMRLMGAEHEGLHQPLSPNREQATATRRRNKRQAAARSNGDGNGVGGVS